MTPLITVFICTRDPDLPRLRRSLAALKAQTLPPEAWELLLVDSASHTPLATALELPRQLQARHLRAEAAGKTHAMLAALRDARAPLLVMFDDDNLPAPDYLQRALEIASKRPRLGAWGGQLIPEWEAPLPPRLQLYEKYLALREFTHDRWSSWPQEGALPVGAGLCFRREVGQYYAQQLEREPLRLRLGPGPEGFLGMCEDLDLAYCSFDLGLGVGLFPKLTLRHVIAAHRVSEPYLVEYVERCAASHMVFEALRGKFPAHYKRGALERVLDWYQALRTSPEGRRHDRATARGRAAGAEFLAAHRIGGTL